MSVTPIEWTEQTWNPVRGCSPVSPGCKNCYAERQGGRFAGPGRPFDGFIQIGRNGNPGPRWTGKVDLIPHMLDVPLRRKIPTTYFVNSMSDLFHEELPDEAIDRVFAVMALCPHHTFQVLTKRAKRMREYFADESVGARVDAFAWEMIEERVDPCERRSDDIRATAQSLSDGPLSNVHLGVSVEDQQRADERIPDLLQTPAAVRFLSVEPLLGPVDLDSEFSDGAHALGCGDAGCDTCSELPDGGRGVDWVIVGGESGPDARPCDTEWVRSIVQQCTAAGVAVFVKQLGAHVIQGGVRRKKADKKGGDMHEWEHDLRVRELPGARA